MSEMHEMSDFEKRIFNHWKAELLDLSRRNRLVYHKTRKRASFNVNNDVDEIFERLEEEASSYEIYFPEQEYEQLEEIDRFRIEGEEEGKLILCNPNNDTEAQNISGLNALRRESNQFAKDTGIWLLHLALGFLEYAETEEGIKASEGAKRVKSPLLLVPVEIKKLNNFKWELKRRENDASVINPTLIEKLRQDFGINDLLEKCGLMDGDDGEVYDASYMEIISKLRSFLNANLRTKHAVNSDEIILDTFNFSTIALYNDISKNFNLIFENSIIRSLYNLSNEHSNDFNEKEGFPSDPSPDSNNFLPAIIPPEELDIKYPPEKINSVLDMDQHQLQCLIASDSNQSFIIDGPPGTGKSQTIVNIIAHLIKSGKSVLFVSEKIAALEVVQKHLQELGLEPFLLEMHSSKITRKSLVEELKQSENPLREESVQDTSNSKQRDLLSNKAQLINTEDHMLEMTLFDAIGKLISATSSYEKIDFSASSFPLIKSKEDFDRILEQVKSLSKNYIQIYNSEGFIWRDLNAGDQHLEKPKRKLLPQADNLLSLADKSYQIFSSFQDLSKTEDIYSKLGLDPTISLNSFQELLNLLNSPPLGTSALTDPDFIQLQVKMEKLAEAINKRNQHLNLLLAHLSNWENLSIAAFIELQDLERKMDDWLSEIAIINFSQNISEKNINFFTELYEISNNLARFAEDSYEAFELLNKRWGTNFNATPNTNLKTIEQLNELGRIYRKSSLPESHWFDRIELNAAKIAWSEIKPLAQKNQDYSQQLSGIFKDTILELENLKNLADHLIYNRRWYRKWKRSYRHDKHTLQKILVEKNRKTYKQALLQLDLAIEYQKNHLELSKLEERYQDSFRFYSMRKDLEEIDSALVVPDRVIEIMGNRQPSADLQKHLSHDLPQEQRLISAATIIDDLVTQIDDFMIQINYTPEVKEALQEYRLINVATYFVNLSNYIERVVEILKEADSILKNEKTLKEYREILYSRHQYSKKEEEIGNNLAETSDSLGDLVNDLDSNDILNSIDWINRVRNFYKDHGKSHINNDAAEIILQKRIAKENLESCLQELDNCLQEFYSKFTLKYSNELKEQIENLPLNESIKCLEPFSSPANIYQVDVWNEYKNIILKLEGKSYLGKVKIEEIIKNCRESEIHGNDLPTIFATILLSKWIENRFDEDSILDSHQTYHSCYELQENFKKIDRKQIDNEAKHVKNQCIKYISEIPRNRLKKIYSLPRKYSIRKRMEEYGKEIKTVRPCFMMSPLSVSHFLPTDINFDYIIFDEASQLRESVSISSIIRAQNLIIAGDEKQLPPTSFFKTGHNNDELDDDDEEENYESLLERAKLSDLESYSLNWHYRSRDESLILFSNLYFYNSQLQTFPAPIYESENLGLELYTVRGIYDRGATRTNSIEADKVVERIQYHKKHNPNLSIGVIAMSTQQQDCIERKLSEENLIDDEDQNRQTSLFVKNLETVQGDERDIIIFSVGYGPDSEGKFDLNFGPLNRINGWRRLNVAITRARNRFEIITSIHGPNLQKMLNHYNENVKYLAKYIKFATEHYIGDNNIENAGNGSPFESEILRIVEDLGYVGVPQVGEAEYKIDIGVRHPSIPGKYILGIECDGATYHSCHVARDRDRLRQQVLESHGWQIYRVWSSTWVYDRAHSIKSLKNALEYALRQAENNPPPK